MEQLEWIQFIPPKGEFDGFHDEDRYKEKLKEWGLSAGKEEFLYKERGSQWTVKIKGFETYGSGAEFNTIVIEFQDGSLSCIHPAYLKEMQQGSFGKESMLKAEEREQAPIEEEPQAAKDPAKTQEAVPKPELTPAQKEPKKPKKEKPVKLDLPAEKVHFTAIVKQFAYTYNPFNEENDEVVVLEQVRIEQDPPLELGLAWCSHSKTLKKFELAKGDMLEFDGKAAAKKLAKGKDVAEEFIIDVPVLYKVNNPSKIVKK